MNAAFLLVTSAMLVGQAGAEKKPAPPPATTTPAVASNCGNDCGGGCDNGRFHGRLRGLFHRNSDACCTPAPAQNNCCDRGGRGHGGGGLFQSRCREACQPRMAHLAPSSCCEQQRGHGHAQSGCNDCGGGGGGFLERLRGLFHRRDRCCDSGCNTVTTTPAKTGEKIDAPKVMPKGGTEKKPSEEVRTNPAPAPLAPATIQSNPAPAIEVVPVPTPRGESLRRDPF